MAAGSTYTPIATTTLGSAASSYTFTSIPSTYTDLVLVYSGIPTNSGSHKDIRVNVGNGSIDTGSNYSYTYVGGNGSSASSGRGTSTAYISTYALAGTYGYANIIGHFQNYSNSTTYKTVLIRTADSPAESIAFVGMWRSTSAINQVRVSISSDAFDVGATFTLYGIAAA